jgi:hypothetical protein
VDSASGGRDARQRDGRGGGDPLRMADERVRIVLVTHDDGDTTSLASVRPPDPWGDIARARNGSRCCRCRRQLAAALTNRERPGYGQWPLISSSSWMRISSQQGERMSRSVPAWAVFKTALRQSPRRLIGASVSGGLLCQAMRRSLRREWIAHGDCHNCSGCVMRWRSLQVLRRRLRTSVLG